MSRAKQAIQAGRPVIAVNPGGVALPVVDILARHGCDCLFVDCERTPISVESVPVLARAAQARGMSALLRSPSKDPAMLTRYLDCGVDGLILPQVESLDECAMLVRTARHATKGREAELLLVAQIESAPAVARVDELATAPGIDLFLIGPNDLAHSMGFLGDTSRPELRAAVDRATERLRACRRPFGLPATPETASDWIARGARLLYVTLDQLVATSLGEFRRAMA